MSPVWLVSMPIQVKSLYGLYAYPGTTLPMLASSSQELQQEMIQTITNKMLLNRTLRLLRNEARYRGIYAGDISQNNPNMGEAVKTHPFFNTVGPNSELFNCLMSRNQPVNYSQKQPFNYQQEPTIQLFTGTK